MNVLIIGSGGREHALAWKISQSQHLGRLFIAPGNAGTASIGTNVPIQTGDLTGIRNFIVAEKIDILVVGPEAPLVDGISDMIQSDPETAQVMVIGPPKAGARLEGSKVFAKEFMARHSIPTAASSVFNRETFNQAVRFITQNKPPFVIKADGLAAGKGVVICETRKEALEEIEAMILQRKFGTASQQVLIEEFLEGIELSAFVITNGLEYKLLPAAKDYKRVGDGDTGLNTGGMGSISPVPFASGEFMRMVEQRIIKPTIEGLRAENIPFTGFIFFGLMNVKGEPYLIEYNVRLGDPEAEAIIPRMKGDLLELFQAAIKNNLSQARMDTEPGFCTAVMLVSGGYPGSFEKGKRITGLDQPDGIILFHAGTSVEEKTGSVVTNGGRVLAVVSVKNSLQEALYHSYETAGKITFEGKYYRKDLGKDLLDFL
jgi:phosphoribosylamine--glycine ligase